MAHSKPEVIDKNLTVAQLNSLMSDLEQAGTPARLLKLLTSTLTSFTDSPVTAFSYDVAGLPSYVDEHALPAELHGQVKYPGLSANTRQPTAMAADWPKHSDVTTIARKLDLPEPRLYLLEVDGEHMGGLIFWNPPVLRGESGAILELLMRCGCSTLRSIQLAEAVKTNLAETMALQRITQAITRSLDFDKVSSTLLRHARKLFHADAAALALVSPDGSEYYVDQSVGMSPDYAAKLRIKASSKLAQRILRNGTPVQLYDVSDAPFSGDKEATAREGIKSVLLAPIFSGGQPVGALGLVSKTPRHFVYSELRFSQSLAEQAGIAFANATLHTNLQKASLEIEQTRKLMRDGLLVFDLDKRLRYYNAAAGSLLKLSEDRLNKAMPPDEILVRAKLTADEPGKFEHSLNAALEGQTSRSDFSSPGHEHSHYEAVTTPYRDTKSKLVGILVNIRDITALYHEKEKFQIIQSNISDGLMMVEANGRVIEHNDEWKRLFNIDEQLAGQNFVDILNLCKDFTIDRPPSNMLSEVLGGKRITSYGQFETRGRHIQMALSPVMSAGQVTGVVVTARDITPLIEKTVEANEMAAKAQRHLRELSQLAELSGIVGFNVSNIFQKYLAKTASLIDCTSVSIYLYDPIEQQLIRRQTTSPGPDDQPTLELGSAHPAAQALATRNAVRSRPDDAITYHQLAVPITHHSKSLGSLLVGRHERPFGEHETRLARLVATRLAVLVENANLYHDVNARRERWEAVFRFTDEGIVIFDRSGSIVGFNPASTEITQYLAAEAIGKPFSKIIQTVGPDDVTNSPNPLERVLGEGVTIAKSEQLILNRTGNRIWTEISYSPIFDDAGRITSGIAIIRNTTKDREVEEIKSDFISIVSHELRTPLTAIKGFLSMTLKNDFGQLSEKQFHYLSRVYQSNQRMIDLVEDLMDATYIESGKINLTISPVAMESVISEVVSELAGKGAANQIMINVRRRQRLPLVLADETRLHQIVLNLVDNAIKYSMPGTTVEVDFKIQDDELITTVSDHGVGISKNQIDRLFTKFGRIFNPLSVQAGGTGLGLYIVKNLVESHGGRIWVTSIEGRGSKFHFSLPIAKQLPLLN
ncbi:MAG TPA: ATP-binding protein [Candidatus Saccharimonadia bacterium]|jgi:PAS domain S-box-containing protein